ncbi:30S ribosomal protein S1 [Alphaproteobacteria bacterium]|nr:30S ribosomal protein S1 [Alphaproteobacteria bacterium]MDC0148051.1 30S ribosomal protein S1 [Alphaproteobacteria bacterium]MDC1241110.1 30S ribosomal protein S1 [bacterium]
MSDMNPTTEDFAALLEENFAANSPIEGSVIKGRVTAVENDLVIVDVGLKTEGRVPLREFAMAGQPAELKAGDEVEVFLERIENANGDAVLSRDKARREESWINLEKSFEAELRVEGVIFGRVKGGFTVDLDGATAFLPGSQVDIRPVRDVTPLMNTPQPFQILKMDRRRGNIVVSRRAIMEETRAEARNEIVQNLVEGQTVEGVVKNITDYGAFVDLGGVDGLLHVTDIAWRRVNHPSEVLTVGETVKVQVVKINSETQRISLGMKQLESDPWDDVTTRFPLQTKVKGQVTNITDYGAFVELGSGIEGLVHVSEMSWVKKNVHPGKIVSTSQEVEVMILEVDSEKRRISLGLKQCMENPWADFSGKYPSGTKVSGEVKNITEFGLFVGLEDDIDGMVHISDLDWNASGDEALAKFTKGQTVEAVVLDVDQEKERVSLGIKQLDGDPFESLGNLRRGDTVTCEVTSVNDGGLEVAVGDGDVSAFIRRSDLSRDREDQRPERFSVGDKLDAMVTNLDKRDRRVGLSIKALEIAEEKEAVAQYGSSDSGASLGDILGAALNRDED